LNTKKFGYIRVSSTDQNVDRQMESMLALGIPERDIFVDKQSGRNFDRPKYQALKTHLRHGDVLYIHSLDRFGRNKEQILNEWREITKNIGADIIVLDMPLLDTTQYKGMSGLETLITDIVLQLLSYFAEEERNKIKTRQAEGIAVAKKKGKHLGRPKSDLPVDFMRVYTEWKEGNIPTAVEAMKKLNMPKSTFYKMVKLIEKR